MLILIGVLLVLFSLTLIFLMPALWAREVHHRYAIPRAVTCPETHQHVGVTIDATHAALTALRGTPEFRLADCSRWPERIKCAQDCLPEALSNQPYARNEVQPSRSKRQIFHLPVLLAACAAWYIGMLWHSQYLFRARWMADLGMSQVQLKQMVGWYAPHLLSIAACLLFAYGVAWVQAWIFHAGILRGILSSVLLWSAVFAVTLPSSITLPRDLFLLEAGYTIVAALAVGAIIGGLSGRMVLRPLEQR